MDRGLGLFLIGLIFGGGIGFFVAAAYGVTIDGHDHADPAQHGAHDMQMEVGGTSAVPGLSAKLLRDPVSGWNLHVMAENFRFAPESAGLADADGEGHAHIYVDGVKLARIYGEWTHLDLPEGAGEVRVALYSNSHKALAVDGVPVEVVLKPDS